MSKNEGFMSLVLWIDQNSFSTNLVERVFKKKGLPFYSLSKASELSYLVEDLRPSLIVLDGETARASLDEFLEEFNQSAYLQQIPFILINDFPELSSLKKIGELRKPLDPFKVPDQIQQILRLHN